MVVLQLSSSISPNSYLRDASPADKNVRRVNTMARWKAVLDFSGIVVIAFWEQLSLFALSWSPEQHVRGTNFTPKRANKG